MPLRFRCYSDGAGVDVMAAWFNSCDGGTRGEFVAFIEALEEDNRAATDEEIVKPLTKRAASRCLGLHELRFDTGKGRCFRILGILEGEVFTMLLPIEKRRDDPESRKYGAPCAEAHARRGEVIVDRQRAQECEFPPPGPAELAS